MALQLNQERPRRIQFKVSRTNKGEYSLMNRGRCASFGIIKLQHSLSSTFEDSSKPQKETKITVKLSLFYHLKNSDDHSVN